MPSFGASGSMSGPQGLNSGPRSNMRMGVAGVSRLEVRGTGNRTGPNQVDPTFNSQRAKVFQRFILSITTKDSTGAALGLCAVDLFSTVDDVIRDTGISDANGVCVFNVSFVGPMYGVSYKAGVPDVAGVTVNTLMPTLT